MIMETDKKRIGVGNGRFPSLEQDDNAVPVPEFTFDSEQVTFDSLVNSFDEE